MTNAIELTDVKKNYTRGSEQVHALQGVTLAVEQGGFTAIVGPSGSGKTTLLQQIGCVDRPTGGRVVVEGEDVGTLSDARLTEFRAKRIGFVFQSFFLLPTLTALENVELPALFARTTDREKRAREMLTRVGLGERVHHRPSQLSGGEMQRVAVARALVNKPKLLLADEPTGNLDSANAEAIFDIFRELNQDGLTIVMVTHNEKLARLARKVIRLTDGLIAEDE